MIRTASKLSASKTMFTFDRGQYANKNEAKKSFSIEAHTKSSAIWFAGNVLPGYVLNKLYALCLKSFVLLKLD